MVCALRQKLPLYPQHFSLFLVGLILLLTSVACIGAGPGDSNYPATPVIPESRGSRFAPDFKIVVYQGEEVLGGKEVPLSSLFSRDLAQRKPVVLNFWAGACPPCRVEMPDLQEMYEEYQGQVLLLGLDVGPFVGLGSREEGQALLEELGVTYPAGTTFDAKVVRDYQILGMPTTVFIKPNGAVVRTWAGLLNKDKMTELVEELLAASSGS
jgi:thiol-disulfide isomerase/thioredoxin